MLVPFGQIPLGLGKMPDGSTAAFYLDQHVLDRVSDEGPSWKADDARYIDEAVSDPDAIFRGLNRANQNGGLCYSVFPTHDPEADDDDSAYGQAAPPAFGRVFLAFVEPAAMGYLVFDWEWREDDGDNPGHPNGWQLDFVERAWHRS